MPLDPHAIEATTVQGRHTGARADLERRVEALERQRVVFAGGAPPSDLPAGVIWINETNSRLTTRIAGVLKSATLT